MKTIIYLIALWSMHPTDAQWTKGKATMYGGNLNGNACGMSGTASAFNNWKYAAIGSSNFDSGYGCGKCYTIKATGAYGNNPSCKFSQKSITVQAIDQCPECSKTHFDLNDDVMNYLTGSSSMAGKCGVVSIQYKRVDCTAIKSNFYIKNKSGTSQYWYGFHLNDVNDDGGIKTVKLYKNGKYVTSCKKSGGPSFWLCANGGKISQSTPLDIQIISDKGRKVTAKNCITSFNGNKIMKCNTNLNKGSAFTEEDDTSSVSTSTSVIAGVIAVVLLTCIICGVAGYCFIKRRKDKAKDAVAFKDSDGDSEGPMQDGDIAITGTGGYDMSPIDTTGGDTPISETPMDPEEIDVEVEIEANETQQ